MEAEGAWEGAFERKGENLSMEADGACKGAFEYGGRGSVEGSF